MTYSDFTRNKFNSSDKGAVCVDSGFLDYSESSAMISSQDSTCADLENMCIESEKEKKQREARENFKWSEVDFVKFNLMQLTHELCYMQDVNGNTLLHEAVNYGHLDVVFWLINLAPSPSLLNIRNNYSFTALQEAVMCEEPAIARKLVLMGADKTIRAFSDGNTALHIACKNGFLGCVRAIIDPVSAEDEKNLVHQDLEIYNYHGKTCLHLATSEGFLDIVIFLVHRGADVNAREGLGGYTAIHLAITNQHSDIAKFIAQERPSSLSELTYGGYSAYQLAIQTNQLALAEELVKLGADPSVGHYDSDSEYTDEDSMSDCSE